MKTLQTSKPKLQTLWIVLFAGVGMIVIVWLYKGISMQHSPPEPKPQFNSLWQAHLEQEKRKSDYVTQREPGEDFKAFAKKFVDQLHSHLTGFSTEFSLLLQKSENLLVPYIGVIEITHLGVRYNVKFYFQGEAGDWKYIQTRGQYIVLGGEWYDKFESNHVSTFHNAANSCMREIHTW